MAIAKLNRVFVSIQGTIGDVVFKRYGDKLVLSRKPRFENRVFSAAQKAAQERFRQAMLLAKAAGANSQVRSTYEQTAKVTGKPILSLMVADFLRPSTIHQETNDTRDGNTQTDKANVDLIAYAA